ncbi:MAG: nucleotide exchange factor GrpE [Rhodospirillales bacterium]|jgi:molecular chaperone GrpE
MTAETEKPPFGEDPMEENTEQNETAAEESIDSESSSSESAGPDDAEAAAGADKESDESPEGSQDVDLEAEVADLKDKLLRALAETENVRRRAQRDKEDANKYAIVSFAREMVEVRDNLRRALDAIEGDQQKDNEAIASLVEGIEMTERTLIATFERFEIKPIEALHQKFDHNFHEALFEVEDASVPSGTVVQELQAGYKIHARLLRPTKVGVSKGGAKVETAPGEAQNESGAPQDEQSVKNSAQAYEQPDPESGGKIDKEL